MKPCQHEWGSLMAAFGLNRRCVKCDVVEPIPVRINLPRCTICGSDLPTRFENGVMYIDAHDCEASRDVVQCQ